MGLEFQYQLCPTLLLADMEIENPSLAFLYALSDEIRAQTSLFGIVPKIYICIISLITMYLLKFYNGHGGFCYAARSFWSWNAKEPNPHHNFTSSCSTLARLTFVSFFFFNLKTPLTA